MSRGFVLRFVLLLMTCYLTGCKGELRPSHDDAKEAFAELVAVQEAHQASIAAHAMDEVAKLPAHQEEAYAEIVRRDTSLALKTWRLRRLQFEYLIDNEPDRLRLRLGREGLVSFNWSPADSTQLASTNPEYTPLAQQVDDLQLWLNEQLADSVQAFFDELEQTVTMRALHRSYARDEQAIVLRYRLAAILKEE